MKYSIFILLFTLLNQVGYAQNANGTSMPDLELSFSSKGGYYEEPIIVELFSAGARIYYTIDGSAPSRKSYRYKTKLKIVKSTPIRAVAYKGKKKSPIIGHTYLINETQTTLPTVSLMIDPQYLFDPENGLYVAGSSIKDSTWRMGGANFWSRRELYSNTEIFDEFGKTQFRCATGFRLFGGMSRLFPQKSITLVARHSYGENKFRYSIFGKKGPKRFKFFVLRNSGSDFGRSNLRDVFMTSLLKGWDIEKQAYRPTQVYLNGDYWGMYNAREKINRFFIADHYDIDKDSIDLLEHRANRKRGTRGHYLKMIDFIENNDFSDPAHYAYIQTQMDVTNFIDYKIAEIYFDNKDAGGNIKYWKPKKEGGKWRWILFDTDWGFGLQSSKAYRYNSLAFHMEPDGPAWPNPPWSTLILRKLMENKSFQNEFVLRFQDFLNTTFDADNVEKHLEKVVAQYVPEMERHFLRWNQNIKQWPREISKMRKFAIKRPEYMRQHLRTKFNLGESYEFDLSVSNGGHLKVNDHIIVKKHDFQGQYFNDFTCKVEAISKNGYTFSHWEGIDVAENVREIILNKENGCSHIKAVFKPYIHPLSNKVVINEIAANDKSSGDWIEIFNNSNEDVSVKDWIIADKKHEFVIPDVSIPEKGYLILVQDESKFKKNHPMVSTYIGDLGFGLNKKKETIQLFSEKGEMIDSVGYDIEPIDTLFCFNLLLPELNNSDIENWEVLKDTGSPGHANPYYLESRIKYKQTAWLKAGAIFGVMLILILVLFLKRRGVLG